MRQIISLLYSKPSNGSQLTQSKIQGLPKAGKVLGVKSPTHPITYLTSFLIILLLACSILDISSSGPLHHYISTYLLYLTTSFPLKRSSLTTLYLPCFLI